MISCISGTLGLNLSVWIWIPKNLITRSRLHSKGKHSPLGLYTQLSKIHNFGVKLITGLCQLIWMVTPRGLHQYRDSPQNFNNNGTSAHHSNNPTHTARKWGQKYTQNTTFSQGQRQLSECNAYRLTGKLTHCSLGTPNGDVDLGQHWFR